MQSCIVICGQTATGKSDLAVCIALYLKKQGYHAEIISADSRQIYKGADTISAKIKTKDMHGIKHHMLSIVDINKDYNVAEYKKEVNKIIKNLHKNKILPIICGGTGLYIDNVVFKKNIPEVLPNPKLRSELEKLSISELFDMLQKKDPERAQTIDQKNKRRLVRALEIINELGYVPKEEKQGLLYKTLFIGLTMPNENLSTNIQKRTLKRMSSGMLKEIKELLSKGTTHERLINLGMEYKWLSLYFQKNITKQECIDGINKDTMAYAKRQMTWFKKNKHIQWLDMTNKTESGKKAKKMVLDFISE